MEGKILRTEGKRTAGAKGRNNVGQKTYNKEEERVKKEVFEGESRG